MGWFLEGPATGHSCQHCLPCRVSAGAVCCAGWHAHGITNSLAVCCVDFRQLQGAALPLRQCVSPCLPCCRRPSRSSPRGNPPACGANDREGKPGVGVQAASRLAGCACCCCGIQSAPGARGRAIACPAPAEEQVSRLISSCDCSAVTALLAWQLRQAPYSRWWCSFDAVLRGRGAAFLDLCVPDHHHGRFVPVFPLLQTHAPYTHMPPTWLLAPTLLPPNQPS